MFSTSCDDTSCEAISFLLFLSPRFEVVQKNVYQGLLSEDARPILAFSTSTRCPQQHCCATFNCWSESCLITAICDKGPPTLALYRGEAMHISALVFTSCVVYITGSSNGHRQAAEVFQVMYGSHGLPAQQGQRLELPIAELRPVGKVCHRSLGC